MEDLRQAARECLQQPGESHALPDTVLQNIAIPDTLESLWKDISSRSSSDNGETCESLLAAQSYLKIFGSRELSSEDENIANSLYEWASQAALPSSVFAETEVTGSSDDDYEKLTKESRIISTLAVSLLTSLTVLLPIHKAQNVPDILIAFASFTSEKDPWVTQESLQNSSTVLAKFVDERRTDDLWIIVERILKERIRPLFSKTRNPAITAAGRKNFHPVPLARFDASILDPESKPWKIHDVYATTVFAWVISQYRPTDIRHLEAHFPLLVPSLLTLIDDESLPFKTRGCCLLSQLLIPIRESKSNILRRTNLSSVFEDAIKPCLLSLPTITPEDDSIQLLQVAYPALFSLLKTSYQIPNFTETTVTPSAKDKEAFISGMTKILRDNLIPSFHHISSTNPTSTSSFASFPHPRLSTLLVNQLCVILGDLSIHTTKYIQEIIPPLYSTLSNPFGPAHPPLLLSAVSATQAVILNAHPRLWRWRGEILGGLCTCWLQVLEEESELAERADKGRISESDPSTGEYMVKLKKQLKGVVYLLKYALQNPVEAAGDTFQLDAQENIEKELKELVEADDSLGGLLDAEIDPNDSSYFGIDS